MPAASSALAQAAKTKCGFCSAGSRGSLSSSPYLQAGDCKCPMRVPWSGLPNAGSEPRRSRKAQAPKRSQALQ